MLHLARLVGTQAEMGAQHGRLVAADAQRLLEFYRQMPARALAGGEGRAVQAVVTRIAETWQRRLARSRPAALVARSRAFAAAAGVPASAELAYATMDSLQNCVSVVARLGLGPFARPLVARVMAAAQPACSTVIAWGSATEDGELLFARNFDFPGVGVWDAAPAFTVCAETGGRRYGFFAAKGADTPVVTVVNDAGLVVAPHTRWHRGVTWGGGMIVDVIHEVARRAETLADAEKVVRELAPSSSWGIAIGSAREKAAMVIEAVGGRVEVVRPPAGAQMMTCTNRYRSAALQAGQVAGSAAWAIHADRRDKRLRQLMAVAAGYGPRDLVKLLADRRDVEAPELERHLGAIVAQPTNVHAAVVKPSAREAWVGVDRAPSCEGAWAHVAWEWDGAVGAAPAGMRAELVDGFAPPQDEATRWVRAAVDAHENAHDIPAARAAIDHAVAAAPDDPSLRLAACWLALAGSDSRAALAHAEAGLARETESYRRGQLLLWASRSATGAARARFVEQLSALRGEGVGELQVAAKRRWRGTPHANLAMHDAY